MLKQDYCLNFKYSSLTKVNRNNVLVVILIRKYQQMALPS